MIFQPKVRGLYVLIAGRLFRVNSPRQTKQAAAELARLNRPMAPIERWTGQEWVTTGETLHAGAKVRS